MDYDPQIVAFSVVEWNKPIEEDPIPLPLSQRERHSTVWFKDGTIVLATPSTLFRVYGGILAHYSPIFRDMFSLSQPDAESENFDGVPVVHLSDDATELSHFLSALHFRS